MTQNNHWIKIGLTILIIGFGGTILWLCTAPLQSAAIAPGIITVEGYRKKIQHLEGGLIANIHVTEGEEVKENQLLIELKKTKPYTRYLQLNSQYLNAIATLDRLTSEINNYDEVKFSENIANNNDQAWIQAKNNQIVLFDNQRKVIKGELERALTKQQQIKEAKNAYISTSALDRKSIAVIDKQLAMSTKLLAKGFASKNQHLELQKDKLEIERRLSDYNAKISKFDLEITEAKQEYHNIQLSYIHEKNRELDKIKALSIELNEQLKEANDTLKRTSIYSPINGKVVGLGVHTISGVISPGEVLMEIVPINDKLIVEALLKTEDIDVVKSGLTVEVTLTAYNRRRTLPISGKITNISADRVNDTETQTSAYSIKVELDESSISQNTEIELYPGMPAEVIILLGERTVLDYLLSPIYSSMNKAFRDSD